MYGTLRDRVMASAERKGLHSVADLARAVATKPQYVFQLLSGDRPAHAILEKIAACLDVSVHWLRDGSAAESPIWARGALLVAIDDAQELAHRLHAVSEELRQEIEHSKALEAELEQLRREMLQVVRSKLVDQVGLPREQRTRYKPTPTPPLTKVES